MYSFYLLLFLVSPILTLQLNEPLVLTPLLKEGKYQEAQDKSLVPSLVPGLPNSGYSGFFQIDEIAKTNLYFWFHPKENDQNWKDAPIVLLQLGSYGWSSLLGAFELHIFPYIISQKGTANRFEWALSQFANVLMIDNANNGFSHTSDQSLLPYSLDHLAEEHYSALEQFFLLFPDLKRRVFLHGISLGGTKAIRLGNMILKRDRKVVDLGGVIFGDSPTDIEGDYSKVEDYFYSFGLWEKKHARQIDDILDKLHAYSKSKDDKGLKKTLFTDLLINSIYETIGTNDTRQFYNIMSPMNVLDKIRWSEFVQLPEIRDKLHVGHLNFTSNFELAEALLISDVFREMNLGFILNHKIPYLKFHGQYDGRITYQSTIKSLRDINWYGQKCFDTKTFRRHQIWIFGRLFGYLRQCLHVWEVFILNVGHVIPLDFPRNLWEVVNTFLKKIK